MPSEDEIRKCLDDRHLSHEIDMLRVGALRLAKVTERGWDTNISIEVFCVHARNLIEFLDGRWAVTKKDGTRTDFIATDFAADYKCEVDLKGQRDRINKRIAHLTTERVRGDDGDKVNVGECLTIYDKLEHEIERFMACLPPPARSALIEQIKHPRLIIKFLDPDDSMLRDVETTSPPHTSIKALFDPRDK